MNSAKRKSHQQHHSATVIKADLLKASLISFEIQVAQHYASIFCLICLQNTGIEHQITGWQDSVNTW